MSSGKNSGEIEISEDGEIGHRVVTPSMLSVHQMNSLS